jgi:anti-sigma-K factor RskA
MINHERYEELISIYAFGALAGNELEEIEDHLKAGCTLCQQMLKDYEATLSLIPYSLPSYSLLPSLKDKLFQEIRATKIIERKPYATSLWEKLQILLPRLVTGIALAFLILLAGYNLSLRGRLSKQQAEISGLKEQIMRQNEIMEFLQNPNVVTINLVGLKADPHARGRVLWDKKDNKALFHGLNLPPIPSGKIYQLWVIADNTPISVGIFDVDEKGNKIIQVKNIPDSNKVQKFAVTLEPEGGVTMPTGEMYLISSS